MWNRFDFKAACLFTGFQERKDSLLDEFRRVGLSDVRLFWQFPTPVDNVLIKCTRHGRLVARKPIFNSTMGHYRVIKTAYEIGSEHCIVMEDDVRFLKDLDFLRDVLQDLPCDYDVALLDSFKPKRMQMSDIDDYVENRKASKFWRRFPAMRSLACYSMSRRAMRRWISLFEHAFTHPRSGVLRTGDQYLVAGRMGRGMNMYFAHPHAAIQVPNAGANSISGGPFPFYRDIGLNVDSYGGSGK